MVCACLAPDPNQKMTAKEAAEQAAETEEQGMNFAYLPDQRNEEGKTAKEVAEEAAAKAEQEVEEEESDDAEEEGE